MLTLSAVFAVLYLCSAAPMNEELGKHWTKFKVAYNKSYSPMEEVERKKIWKEHVSKIFHHNLDADLGTHTYTIGLNEYADMAPEEFTTTMNGFRRPSTTQIPSEVFKAPANLTLPGSVDWRQKGLVTGVKDQKQCGSCWAFSATGSLEGQNKKKTGRLVSLSEQNLIDCSSPEGDYGCNGGWPAKAFEYISLNKGIDTEKSYPYTAANGVCHYTVQNKGATCIGYVNIASGDEAALQQAVAAVGPVSVAIDASQWSFQLYKSGVYNEQHCSTNNLDHAVLVVGYGSENGEDYWLVKNSWGRSWGENGYIKMSRNKNNQCGIATSATFPLV